MTIQDNDFTRRNTNTDGAQSGGWDLHGGGIFDNPIPKGIGSDYFNKIKQSLVDIYKTATNECEIGVLELTRATDPALDYSCILVCVKLTKNPDIGVAYHVLLLSKTGDNAEEETQPYVAQFGTSQVNIYSYPSDSVDETLITKATAKVSSHYNISKSKVYYVDANVIGYSFNHEDPQALQALALNSAMPGMAELKLRSPNFNDINLAELKKIGNTSIELDFQRQNLIGINGAPFRSGFTIKLVDRKNVDKRTNKRNNGDSVRVFSELSSFMEVLWNPMNDTSSFGMAFSPQQYNTQKFVARSVLTDVRLNFPTTPGATLLAIWTALAIRQPKYWVQAFSPSLAGNRKEIDLCDIGALNIEGNIPVLQGNGITAPDPSNFGKIINTKGDDFTNEQLGYYIKMLFQTQIMFAIDVPESGPQSHYLGIFLAAVKQESAYNRIISAANNLTNGEFSKYFAKGDSLFASEPERIHLGTWVDFNGKTRDIREFDYLAVANLIGAKEPSFLKDWSDTFLRTDYPEPQRFEARRNMIRRLSNDTAKFTGTASRLTLSAKLLEAIDKGVASQQFLASIRSSNSGNDYIVSRGTASWAQNGMVSGNMSSAMNIGGYQNNNNQNVYTGMPYNRW